MEHGTTAGRDVLPTPEPRAALDRDSLPDTARAGAFAAAPAAPAGTSHAAGRSGLGRRGGRGGGVRGGGVVAGWPLAVVLVVQAVLSLRLVRADTAFQDEALYLWAGHREWAHLLHGAALPPFAAYFSGSPVIYPPLGAVADSAGGLAGARVLSLVFMLGATALVWAATSALAGRRAAFFAAALFGVAGPTLHLGAFATYDGLAVLLAAAAACCAVRAAGRRDATGWLVAAGVALAAANAAAYSSVLADPVVIALAALAGPAWPGAKAAARRAATLAAVTLTLLLAGTLIGGSPYLRGISQTTIFRAGGTDPARAVLAGAWSWTGLITVLAVAAAVIARARREPAHRAWLLALLAAAALAAPLEQAALHSTASLSKHVEFGLWFAAIAAGYAADQFIAAAPARWVPVTCGACAVALALPLSLGITQARALATAWPSSAAFTAILAPLASRPGRLLVEDPSIAEYYLRAGTRWQRWSSTRNIVLPSGASTGGPASNVTGDGNATTFARYIAAGYFRLIALNFADTTTLDHQIRRDIAANPRYHLIQVIPYGTGTYIIFRHGSHP